MLNGFAQGKAAQVAGAVGSLRAALSRDGSDVAARFGALSQAASSATSALQVWSTSLTPRRLHDLLIFIVQEESSECRSDAPRTRCLHSACAG